MPQNAATRFTSLMSGQPGIGLRSGGVRTLNVLFVVAFMATNIWVIVVGNDGDAEMTLNHSDYQLLRPVVVGVTEFDASFAAEIWDVSIQAAKRRLRRLERKSVIESRKVLAAKLPRIERPIAVFKPGEVLPDCGSISSRARSRWNSVPVTSIRVYAANTIGRALLGREPVKPPKDVQATHNLGLAETFLMFRRRWPVLTKRCWRGESEYAGERGRFVKVEDAMLVRGGKPLLLVDFIGAYRKDRVKDLIEHADRFQVPIALF